MDKYTRQIVVSGLSPETTKDDLELSFESERVYPSPGTVVDVELSPSSGTAIITFEEEEVVKRLVRLRTVTINADGQQLTVTCCPQTRPKATPKPSSKPVPKPRKSLIPDKQSVTPTSFDTTVSSTPMAEYNEVNDGCDARDFRSCLPYNFGDWWAQEDSRQNQLNPSQKVGHSDDQQFFDLSEEMTVRSCGAKITEENSDTYGSCKSDNSDIEEDLIIPTESATVFAVPPHLTEDDSVITSENVVVAMPQQPTAVQSEKLSQLESDTSDSITFPVQQVQLLAKLAASGKVTFACKVEMAHNNIKIFGTSDKVMKTKIEIYEILCTHASTGAVSITQGVIQLLQSDRGDKWLNEQLAQRHLVAVFYVESKSPMVIAADGDALRDARNWFKAAFMSEEIQIEAYHRKFLETSEWNSTISCLKSSSRLLEITVNLGNLKVVIDGLKDDVTTARTEIDCVIRKRSKIDLEVTLKPCEFPVLHKIRTKVKEKISDFVETSLSDGKVTVHFDEKNKKITLQGCVDDITAVEDYIQSEFVSKIYYDSLELNAPGLTIDDFMDKEASGNEKVDAIERIFSCFIEVTAESKSVAADVKSPATSHKEKSPPAPPKKFPSSAIKVVKGNLPEFQEADVLVNAIASKKSELQSAGAVAAAFLKAAGPELQEQLKSAWPQKVGKDIVCVPASGKVKAKKIYNIALRKYSSDGSRLLQSAITLCLETAVRDQMTSIAFPTMGCGKLGFDPDLVAECFVQAECHCQTKLTIYIVAFEDDLKQKFESALYSKAKSSSSPADSPKTSTVTAALVTSPASHPTLSLEVRQGSLTDFKADVLVNLITNNKKDLSQTGVVAKSFLKAGGSELQTEFDSQPFPTKFGEDFAITKATGKLQATSVYHAAVRKYEISSSEQKLSNLIGNCLKKAVRENMASIAFPTVGCGNLGFDPALVARCFLRAQQDSGASIKVFIIAYEDSLQKSFSDVIFGKSAATAPACEIDEAPGTPSPPATEPVLIFHISTLNKSSVDDVKKQLKEKVLGLIETDEKTGDIVEELTPEFEMQIRKLQSADIRITIDKPSKRIIMTGKKDKVKATKKEVAAILKKQQDFFSSMDYVKMQKGVNEYLRLFGCRECIDFPSYWSADRKGNPSAKTKIELSSTSPEYQDVEKIVIGTWEASKAGNGNDAAGLTHKSIAVKKVWRNEIENLFRKYDTLRKTMCKRASVHPIPSTDGLKGEWEVQTRKLGLQQLEKTDNLVSEINECYLLHGTKQKFKESIMHGGLDFRMAGKSTGTMFGKGVYLAESSTKADQYTDDKKNRVGVQQPLYMFVMRTLLGSPYLCQKPHEWLRPPCSIDSCLKDDCTEPLHINLSHDSVIGTHRWSDTSKTSTTRLIFREFIIFDLAQCYPEYLVEYERL